MNNNTGKELVRMRGEPGEVSERREYTIDGRRRSVEQVVDAKQTSNLRKRDWLDKVGAFLDDDPDKDRSFGGFLRACKEVPKSVAFELAPLGLVLGVGMFCAMDSYHWNLGKFSVDALRAMPTLGLGEKALTKELGLIVPEYRVKAGETPDETQRRRACLEARLFRDGDRYVVGTPAPRGSLGDCNASAVTNPGREQSLAK